MRNIKLTIEYDGTCYAGWQRQNNAIAIQEKLETAIKNVVGEQITLFGSGRTDAGVHALNQIANFKTSTLIPSQQLHFAINAHLPDDIVVKSSQDVDENFQARFDAKWKVYKYTVYNNNIPLALSRNFCHFLDYPLNLNEMRNGAELLKGKHDFSSFKTGAKPDDNNVRELKVLDIKRDGKYIYFVLEGNGFLRKMVRRIVGALLEIGRGKMSVENLRYTLASKDPKVCIETAPAKGLCLIEVKY